jgi:hypothetical protein
MQARGKAKKSTAHNQKVEIKKLQDGLKQASKRKKTTKIAVWRLEGIRDEDEEKATNQEVKQQPRQEIEKRLDSEQQVFDMKEGIESLRKEMALAPITIVRTANGDLDQILHESGKVNGVNRYIPRDVTGPARTGHSGHRRVIGKNGQSTF